VIERVSESFREATLSVLRIAFLSALVLEFLATMSTALVAVTIGLRLVYGTLSFSAGLFLLLLAPEFYTPLRTLGLNFHAGLAGVNAAGRIFEIMDRPVMSDHEVENNKNDNKNNKNHKNHNYNNVKADNLSELVQLKLNIETSVTKASSTIVSSGEYRRSRDPYRNTCRRRIGFRRSRTSQKELLAAKSESTPTEAEHEVPLPLVEVGVSRLDDNQENVLRTQIEQVLSSDFHISFQHVSLIYQMGEPLALNGINLSLRSGEKIALVGPSGAGKTSLAQIILRFIEPSAGEVYVNGSSLKTILLENWRKQIAYVPQNPFLFAGSIVKNIHFGRPSATIEEVMSAAQAAFAHEFILELPDGYQTLLGEGGTRLSGGQAQRLAIARAILKDAPMLILDEATSGLDLENERYVQQALKRLMQGKTALIIAHRLSTVCQADRILVMDQGQIVEEGKHEELMIKQGLYYRMVTEYRGESL